MKILNPIEVFLIRATEKRKVSKKQLFNSYVSLFLAFSILVVATFSWFTAQDKANLGTSAITVTNSSGLRVNHGDDISSNIILSKEVKLAEASSVDGRNIFFPTTGTFPDAGGAIQTAAAVFREGNVGDKNIKYYYNNFTLDVDSDNTEVYVKAYSVKVTDEEGKTQIFDGSVRLNENEDKRQPKECPIRIAFIRDSREKPVVIDPTALIGNYAKTYQAVSSINSNGEATTATSGAHAFSEYYFSTHNPLFRLNADEILDGTMVVWLEGTGGNCDMYAGGTVEINIQLESNWDYMDEIKFVDRTKGDGGDSYNKEINWIADSDCVVIMTYDDTRTNKTKAIIMSKSSNYSSDHTWSAALPEYIVKNIRFMRYDPAAEEIWNVWYTEDGINDKVTSESKNTPEYEAQILQESRLITEDDITYRCIVYEAIRGNGKGITDNQEDREAPCIGYWRTTGGIIVDEEIEETTTPTTPAVTYDWYLSLQNDNWSTNNNNYHFSKTSANKYKLVVDSFTAGAENNFRLYDKDSGKYYYYTADITDQCTNKVLTEDAGTSYTKLHTTGGKYTFIIDTSDSANIKLSITREIVSNEETVTIILQDNVNNAEKTYYIVDSDGNQTTATHQTTNGGAHRYQAVVELKNGAKITSILNATDNKSYVTTQITFEDGKTYTINVNDNGINW